MSEFSEYKHGQFNWVDLNSHDMKSAIDFYGNLFGWTCETQDTEGGPPYGIFQLGSDGVAGIGEMNEEMKSGGMPPCWNSYINVEGIEEVVQKVKDLGGQIVMPVMQVLDAGKMAFVQEPTGGIFALWEKGTHIGATRCKEAGTFCWNELVTRSPKDACEFFQKLFGWEFENNEQSPAEYYVVKNDGVMNGGIMAMDESWGQVPSHWSVYFSVEDANTVSAKISELGGKVHHGPFDTEVGPIAVCADPQGAMFDLIQLRDNPE